MNKIKPLRFEVDSKGIVEDIVEKNNEEIQNSVKMFNNPSFYSLLGFLTVTFAIIFMGSFYEMYREFDDMFSFNNAIGIVYLSLICVFLMFVLRFLYIQNRSLNAIKRVTYYQNIGDELIKYPSRKLFAYLGDILREYENRDNLQERIELVRNKVDASEVEEDVIHDINYVLEPLDRSVDSIILDTAKKNAIFTAISPIAIIDVLILTVNNYKMAIDIYKIYGFKPSVVGNMIVFKRVVENLIFAGVSEMASDGITELLGQSAISKITFATSQGLANAVFTIRIGLSAKELSRPLRTSNQNSFKWLVSMLSKSALNSSKEKEL